MTNVRLSFSHLALLAALAACGAHDKQLKIARAAEYQGDATTLFESVRDIVVAKYRRVRVNPVERELATAWQQPRGAPPDRVVSTSAKRGLPHTTIREYVRFDIRVEGGPPWRVRVEGHAATWQPDTALPIVFRESDRPAWLEIETDALVLAIYRRLAVSCPNQVCAAQPRE